MSYQISKTQLLWGIIILAFVLRVWGLGQQEMLGDEAGDAFRAIGYVDYLGTSEQTTPIDWYRNSPELPWWTKLSFHDLPPLTIIFQHISSTIFGFSIFAVRLPAVLMGTLATLLVFWITRRVFDEQTALWSAGWWAVSGAMTWISRTAIIEPYLIFFILLNMHAFLLFVDQPRRWWWFGVTLGLIGLTKYTGVVVAPVYISYLFVCQRSLFRNWRLYAAGGVAGLVLGPVIIYNYYLYRTTGHFDLQIAYLLKQDVSNEWRGLLGKVQAPFKEIGIHGPATWGWGLIIGFFSGLVGIVWRSHRQGVSLIAAYTAWVTLLLLFIGSAPRFLTLYGPVAVLVMGVSSKYIWEAAQKQRWYASIKLVVIVWLIAESVFLIHKIFIAYPDFGVAKLDHYFEEEFRGKESGVIPEGDQPHLNKIIYSFADKKVSSRPRMLSMIIYNDNLALPTIEWVFYRRFFYQSIPTMFVENFSRALAAEGSNYFKPFTIYFVQSTEHTLLNPAKAAKTVGKEFEDWLQQRGFSPVQVIYGQENQPMFRIYKFTM